jgi:murein L,D-transpeptidase YcbB/YkuD
MFTADTETVGQTDDLQERISKVRSGLMQANLLELVDKLSNASETIDQVFTGVRQA